MGGNTPAGVRWTAAKAPAAWRPPSRRSLAPTPCASPPPPPPPPPPSLPPPSLPLRRPLPARCSLRSAPSSPPLHGLPIPAAALTLGPIFAGGALNAALDGPVPCSGIGSGFLPAADPGRLKTISQSPALFFLPAKGAPPFRCLPLVARIPDVKPPAFIQI